MSASVQPAILFGSEEAVNECAKSNKKCTNRIRTTRYTIVTWFPKSLLWQFRRIDNFYFLLITILTCMYFSPKKPSTQIATFAFILFFTMVKEAIEDYYRYKQDKETNLKASTVVSAGKDNAVNWESIKLGQFLKVKKNEEVPADLLIVKTSNPKGIVYIDTMNIDGEVK